MVIDGAAILIRRVVIFAQKLGELSQNLNFTNNPNRVLSRRAGAPVSPPISEVTFWD
jgi:hypothetical protein